MSELFWNTIANYNASTWSMQIIICIIGAILTITLYHRPNPIVKRIFKLFMSFVFGWISIVFFLINGSLELNKYITAIFFALIGLLWLIDFFTDKITFERNNKYNKEIRACYLLFLSYPIFSMMLGHDFPSICTYLMPCPMVVYTLSILISFSKKLDYKIVALLIFWAITGLPKIFMFNVPEDIILFLTGVYAIKVFLYDNHYFKKNSISDEKAGV